MWAIRADMDDAMEKATHMSPTALCSHNLAATADTPISLYHIQDHSDPEWKARLDGWATSFKLTTTVVVRTW
jgi:hypothetical protein